MKKRSRLLTLVLVFAFALTGIAYAAWTDSLQVDGTVNTGNIDVQFSDAWTNDQGVDPNLQGGVSLLGYGTDYWPGWPWWPGDPGCPGDDPVDPDPDPPVCPDRDDVAQTNIAIVDRDANAGFDSHEITNSILEVTTVNAYPGYESEITYQLVNKGTVPVKLTGVVINDQPGYVDVDHPNFADLQMVIYPEGECNQEVYEVTFTQSVNEGLSNKYMNSEFKYSIVLEFGQWNL